VCGTCGREIGEVRRAAGGEREEQEEVE